MFLSSPYPSVSYGSLTLDNTYTTLSVEADVSLHFFLYIVILDISYTAFLATLYKIES